MKINQEKVVKTIKVEWKNSINANTINNVFSEVYDIICHMDEDLRNKIPKRFIEIIKENRNLNYNVNIDYNQNINKWNIIYDTKVMLSVIYRDFLVDDKKRYELKKNDRLSIEEKYNTENLFKNNKDDKEKVYKEQIKDEKSLVVVKKERFYHKVINFIRKIFH